MVCIYYQYKEYKEGAIRPNAAPDLVKFQTMFFQISAIWCNSQGAVWAKLGGGNGTLLICEEKVPHRLSVQVKKWTSLVLFSFYKYMSFLTRSKTDFQPTNRKSRTMSPLVSSKRASLSRICEEESGNQCLSSDRWTPPSTRQLYWAQKNTLPK